MIIKIKPCADLVATLAPKPKKILNLLEQILNLLERQLFTIKSNSYRIRSFVAWRERKKKNE